MKWTVVFVTVIIKNMFSSLVLAWSMVLSDDGSLLYESLHFLENFGLLQEVSFQPQYFLVSTWQFWAGFSLLTWLLLLHRIQDSRLWGFFI